MVLLFLLTQDRVTICNERMEKTYTRLALFMPPPPPPPHPHQPVGRGTYCFWDGSYWPWRRRKTSCPLCNLNTFWNILMILGNSAFLTFGVTSLCYILLNLTTLPFLLSTLSPFVISYSDYPLILCPLCKSKTLWNIFMTLGRNVEQDQITCCVEE